MQNMNPQNTQLKSAVRYQDYLVTPKIAKEWLEFSEKDEEFRNRKLDEARVKQYTSDMKAGRWQSETGENIKFAPDGVLIDGQHRLHSIIRANVLTQSHATSINDAFFLLGIATFVICLSILLEIGWSAYQKRKQANSLA